MTEVEIGQGKSGRRAYELRDVAIVPSRRTRDRRDVDVRWEIDAYEFDVPVLGSAGGAASSPARAIDYGRAGGAGIFDLESLWTRYDDPASLLEELDALGAATGAPAARTRLKELQAEPIKPELVSQRIAEIKDAGVITCVALRPQRVEEFATDVLKAEPDLFVIHGRVVSAEHVSRNAEPLNLKQFIRSYDVPVLVGGCASYQAALHLMRSGAVGVLVGVRGVPQATAIADAAGARMRHLVETGVYVHVIANGEVHDGDDAARAVACGADAVVTDTPAAAVPEVVDVLRREMALSGHETLREFQKADVVVLH